MRYIVYGVGAIGGVIAAALVTAGVPVLGIARGDRLAALRDRGMDLRSPKGSIHVRFDCAASARAAGLERDDVILLAVKSQDTPAALADLAGAGLSEQAVFCVQNGVANEPTVLRCTPNAHGVNVMLPADYMSPGETIAWCSPNFGNFDLGRYPSGTDAADAALAADLTRGGIAGYPTPRVMDFKYGKLIQNLGNIVEAALGRGTEGTGPLSRVLKEEGMAVLDRLGIAWRDVGANDPRRQTMRPGEVTGVTRIGSSTSQSLARGAGTVETDFLNGEIVLLGRLHGIETPANAFAARLGARLVRDRLPPGSVTHAEFAAGLGLQSVSRLA